MPVSIADQHSVWHSVWQATHEASLPKSHAIVWKLSFTPSAISSHYTNAYPANLFHLSRSYCHHLKWHHRESLLLKTGSFMKLQTTLFPEQPNGGGTGKTGESRKDGRGTQGQLGKAAWGMGVIAEGRKRAGHKGKNKIHSRTSRQNLTSKVCQTSKWSNI